MNRREIDVSVRTMRVMTWLKVLGLGAALANTGCIKAMLADGQIEATRNAAPSFDGVGDYELARSAISASLAQFQGMHYLRPENEDALFLLMKGWTGYGYAFPQDDWEAAKLGTDESAIERAKFRAQQAFERGIFYGTELVSKRAKGFETARKNRDALKKWATENFTKKADAENLFWLGYAWALRVNVLQDEPAAVSTLWVGITLLERSAELDPEYNHSSASIILGVYHSRSPMAEPEQSKALFDAVIQRTNGKFLLAHYNYAATYACVKTDRELYEKLLTQVVTAPTPDPSQRLANAIAKRKAARGLSREAMMACGFDMAQPVPKPEARP